MPPSCAVCQDGLDNDVYTYAAKCGHVLHYPCWQEWLKRSLSCPECRRPASEKELIKLFLNNGDNVEKTSDFVKEFCCKVESVYSGLGTLKRQLKSERAKSKRKIEELVQVLPVLEITVNSFSDYGRKINSLLTKMGELNKKIRILRVTSSTSLALCRVDNLTTSLTDLKYEAMSARYYHKVRTDRLRSNVRNLGTKVNKFKIADETEFFSLKAEVGELKLNLSTIRACNPKKIDSLKADFEYLEQKIAAMSSQQREKIANLQFVIRDFYHKVKLKTCREEGVLSSLKKSFQDLNGNFKEQRYWFFWQMYFLTLLGLGRFNPRAVADVVSMILLLLTLAPFIYYVCSLFTRYVLVI